jgi:hypothetical protein
MVQGPVAAPAGGPSGSPLTPSGNPFNALFSPDNGGILGLIGKISGNPTRAEARQSKMADAQRLGLAGFQKRLDEGMPMQAAMVDFINSKEGVNFWQSSTDPVATLKEYVLTTQGKPKDDYTVGNTRFSGSTNQPIATAPQTPTADEQNFETFSNIAKMTPAEKQDAARQMVLNKAGVFKAVPVYNEFGQVVGQNVMDVRNGQLLAKPPVGATVYPSAEVPQAGTAPGASQAPAAAQPTLPPGPPLASAAQPAVQPSGVSGDIILGTGLIPGLQSVGGGLLEQAMPQMFSENNDSNRNQLGQIAVAFQNLQKSMAGKSLASDKALADVFAKPPSITEGPQVVGQRLLDGLSYLDRLQKSAEAVLANPNLAPETKKKQSDLIADIEGVRATMPTAEAIQASMAKYAASQGQVVPGVKAAGELPGQLKKAGTDIENAAKEAAGVTPGPSVDAEGRKVFATPAEAAAAAKAGTLKVGDKVVIGGQKGTMH